MGSSHLAVGRRLVLLPCVLLLFAAAAPAGADNVLRNSGFTRCANPGIPDWWSNSGSPKLADWPACWRPDDAAPLPGVRSMRLRNPEPRGDMRIQSCGYPAARGKTYRWAIYLKTDTPGGQASLSAGSIVNQKLTPTTEWQRFTGTGVFTGSETESRFWFTLSWGAKGTLWVCAPQICDPEEAAYAPSPLDNPPAGGKPPAPTIPKWPIPQARCPGPTSAPAIDGRLDDAAWQSAARLAGFVRYDSADLASQQTEARVTRDGEKLYLGIRCREASPAGLVAKAQGARDVQVFLDDDLEVFLSPYADGRDYRQFAVNCAGARYEGIAFDAAWDGAWQSAVGREEGAWTVEMAIPFASLGYGPGVGDTWRLNLCRHRAQEPAEYSTWSRVPGMFHVPERFGKLAGMAGPDLRAWQVGFTGVQEKEGALTANLWSAGRRAGTVEVLPRDGGAPLRRTPVRAGSGRRGVALGQRADLPGDTARLRFLDAAGQTVCEASFPLSAAAIPEEPLQAWLNRSFYTDPSEAKVIARVAAPNARVSVNVENGGMDTRTPDALGWAEVPLPLGAARQVSVTVRLVAADGKLLSEKRLGAPVLSPAPAAVPWDPSSGTLIRDGKPYIPVAMGAPATLENVRDIAAAGFNAADLLFRHTMKDEEVKAVLDECRRLGLGVIFWDHMGDLKYPAMKEKILHWCALFRDHPAVLTWKVVDEPEGWWAKTAGEEADLKDLHDAVAAADPYRPNFKNHWEWRVGYGGYGGLAATDICSVDRYPIGRQPFNDAMANLSALFGRMQTDARREGKPIHFWLQMYGSYDSPREPTPQEQACQTWLSLVHGTRLISYFFYKPMSVELWGSMRGLRQEVTSLAHVLGTPEIAGAVHADQPAIHSAAFRHEGAWYVVTVNATDAPVKARLRLAAPAEGTADVLFENRRARVERGALSDRWAPMERHVYRIAQ